MLTFVIVGEVQESIRTVPWTIQVLEKVLNRTILHE